MTNFFLFSSWFSSCFALPSSSFITPNYRHPSLPQLTHPSPLLNLLSFPSFRTASLFSSPTISLFRIPDFNLSALLSFFLPSFFLSFGIAFGLNNANLYPRFPSLSVPHFQRIAKFFNCNYYTLSRLFDGIAKLSFVSININL